MINNQSNSSQLLNERKHLATDLVILSDRSTEQTFTLVVKLSKSLALFQLVAYPLYVKTNLKSLVDVRVSRESCNHDQDELCDNIMQFYWAKSQLVPILTVISFIERKTDQRQSSAENPSCPRSWLGRMRESWRISLHLE